MALRKVQKGNRHKARSRLLRMPTLGCMRNCFLVPELFFGSGTILLPFGSVWFRLVPFCVCLLVQCLFVWLGRVFRSAIERKCIYTYFYNINKHIKSQGRNRGCHAHVSRTFLRSCIIGSVDFRRASQNRRILATAGSRRPPSLAFVQLAGCRPKSGSPASSWL
jgi:hypothetical protein